MKKLIFSGILATMFAISASFAQITHSLDTTNLTVGTTTIDSVKFVYGGLVSANLPASVRIDYVAGSGPVNGSNYSSIGPFAINDTAGVLAIAFSGLTGGTMHSINYAFNGFGTSFFMIIHPGSDLQIITLGPPSITLQPVSQSKCEGLTATFTCSATGNPSSFTYQWYEDLIPISGATDSTYSVVVSMANDGSVFKCLVMNAQGSTYTNGATLTVKAAALITQDPQSVTIDPGQSTTLSVSATGSGLTYKWMQVATGTIWGTNSNFTFTPSAPSDSMTVVAIVTGECGSPDTSNAATISVSTLPPDITDLLLSSTTVGVSGSAQVNGYGVSTQARAVTLSDSTAWVTIGSGPGIFNFSITGYQSCEIADLTIEAKSSVATTQLVSQFQTLLANPTATADYPLPGSQVTSSSLTVTGTWDSNNGPCADAGTSYQVVIGLSSTNLPTASAWTYGGVTNGIVSVTFNVSASTTYFYRVKVKNVGGKVGQSDVYSVTTPAATVSYSIQVNNLDAYESISQGPVLAFTLTSNDISATYRTKAGPDPNLGLGSVVSDWQIFGAVTGMDIVMPLALQPGTNYVTLQYKGVATNYSILTTDTIPILIPGATGIEEAGEGGEVKVFPNPATDFVTIETQDKGELTLSNILGEVVAEKTLVPGVNKLEVTDLSPGLYFYKVGENAGKLIVR
ncbi:hypothetical protein A3A09_01000 [Candidatus Nomurabacteria bacterium RIFCSPLOWO2_01_FULL_42_20]|uniref:Ig-like domain-containing protein n=1 Tax=Candidatus Nomurabacteria bacterium RIFCSPHIGHO2_01_FULL_42_16 TaxID=1801743 RepID=A0A1F6VIP5_9BACT|nr:MAG: hypothetical protein A2824_03295 [Candidatus Nomurabacteria bacterium RIFCSPHIGHO2_01_FULL_42_16]OGI91828.1 MAG: hypothetical protein A3A09_01000 [Candidatus Nomurabacteria bacterium RIFCSPLOWO2_01_FULL_42_20]